MDPAENLAILVFTTKGSHASRRLLAVYTAATAIKIISV